MPLTIGVVAAPVIYCGGAGGGPNEYAAPPLVRTPYVLDIPALADKKVHATWYTVLDNIGDFSKFHEISVDPLNGDDLSLAASSQPGAVGRIRIAIYAAYE